MCRLYRAADDFEALIRIYSAAEGGRATPTFKVIRWSFACADDRSGEHLHLYLAGFPWRFR